MQQYFQKKYFLGLIVLGLVGVVGIGVFLWLGSSSPKEIHPALSEIQEVQKSTQDITELPLTPERLRQLEQLEAIVTAQESAYKQTLASVFARTGGELDPIMIGSIESLLEESLTVEETQTKLKELGVERILLSDTRRLMEAYQSQQEEREVHQLRLENLRENNTKDREKNERELIVLIISEQLEKNSTLSSERQANLNNLISTRLSQNTQFFEMSKVQKYDVLSQLMTLSFSRFSEIDETQSTTLRENILSDLETMMLIESPQSRSAETSWFQKIFPEVYASEVENESYSNFLLKSIRDISALAQEELTDTRKKILHLQIDILTDIIIEQLIDGGITGSLTSEEKTGLYHILEEILLLKESIENPSGNLSLDEIQAYNLGQYIDDSALIQEQDPLAFIASRTGYIFVQNLNGSYKLGESNILLYPGYALETGENSEATLVFADESILRLEANSRVVLSGTPANLNTEVESGSIWARVIKPIVSGSSFDIKGSGVSLGVRGTSLYFSQSSGELYIVDSHSDDASVELDGGHSLQAGQKLDTLSPTQGPSDFTRQELLESNPNIGNFLRDDLRQLSLLLDDKTRGFHNNPLSSLNGDSDYLERLASEIENSLPQGNIEKSRIFLSDEIRNIDDTNITLDSLYRLSLQDRLLSALKASNSPYKEENKNILLASDFEALENELGNKRALERRYELGLARDIIDTDLGSTQDLEEMIRTFPIPQRETEREILEQAALGLGESLNGGSRVMLENFPLPENYDDVRLSNWISSNADILTLSGDMATRSYTSGSAILTVTLTLGQQSINRDYSFELPEREPSLQDELEEAAEEYLSFLQDIEYFTTTSSLQAGLSGSILRPEDISFSQNSNISTHGNITRPGFNDFDTQKGDTIRSTDSALSSSSRYKKISNLQITFTHPQDSTVQTTENATDLYLKNAACNTWNGSIILGEGADAVCYSLVAKAEYNEAGKYDLLKDGITLVSGNAGPGLSQNTQNLTSLLTQYTPVVAPLSSAVIDLTTSLVKVEGETGIIIQRNGTGSYLSYDLTQLPEPLGDDWAIEMSVWGEDLRRDDISATGDPLYNSILSIPGKIFIRNLQGSFGKNDIAFGPFEYTGLIENGYKNIRLTQDKFYYGNNYISNIDPIDSIEVLKIGSDRNDLQQWNGIINFFKVYKKN